MKDWAIEGASHRIPLILHNPGRRKRTDEPVEVAIHFSMFRPLSSGLSLTDSTGSPVPCQVLDSSEAEPNRLNFRRPDIALFSRAACGLNYRLN